MTNASTVCKVQPTHCFRFEYYAPHILRITASRLLILSDKYRPALAAAIPPRVWEADEWATFTRTRVDRK